MLFRSTKTFAVYHHHSKKLEFLHRFDTEDRALEYCLSQYYAIHQKRPLDLSRPDLSHTKDKLDIQKNLLGCLLIANDEGITCHPLGPDDSWA